MEVTNQANRLYFNMDRDSHINHINNTEATEPVQQVRGIPKQTIQNQRQNKRQQQRPVIKQLLI